MPIEDVDEGHDLLLPCAVRDIDVLEEPVIGSSLIARPRSSDATLLEIISVISCFARDDKRDRALIFWPEFRLSTLFPMTDWTCQIFRGNSVDGSCISMGE